MMLYLVFLPSNCLLELHLLVRYGIFDFFIKEYHIRFNTLMLGYTIQPEKINAGEIIGLGRHGHISLMKCSELGKNGIWTSAGKTGCILMIGKRLVFNFVGERRKKIWKTRIPFSHEQIIRLSTLQHVFNLLSSLSKVSDIQPLLLETLEPLFQRYFEHIRVMSFELLITAEIDADMDRTYHCGWQRETSWYFWRMLLYIGSFITFPKYHCSNRYRKTFFWSKGKWVDSTKSLVFVWRVYWVRKLPSSLSGHCVGIDKK